MKKMLMCLAAWIFIAAINAHAQQAGYCDCYGGMNAEGEHWKLLDHEGRPLEDGDWVYIAWTGHDGQIDPPDASGYPTGDDVKLPVATERIEYSSLFLVVATWEKGYRDTSGQDRHPMDGELIYGRIFDGPPESIGPGSYYADSQIHVVEWKMGDTFFCAFPGDPKGGHTNTPVPITSPTGRSSSPSVTEAELRQIYPNLLRPALELEYTVPADGPVSLRIYDLNGRQAAALVDVEMRMGVYTERWDGEELPGGVYVAELKAGDEKVLKRIVVIQ
jgi:hypothetical protein